MTDERLVLLQRALVKSAAIEAQQRKDQRKWWASLRARRWNRRAGRRVM